MRNITARLIILLACSAVAATAFTHWSAAEGLRRRAYCYRSIPRYDYQTGVSPLRATAASFPAVAVPVGGADSRTKKVFVPLVTELSAGDCSLSQAALVLYSDAHYTLSFRAKNAAASSVPEQAAEPQETAASNGRPRIEAGPVRHHRVRVLVRFYAGLGSDLTPATQRADGVLVATAVTPCVLLAAGDEQAVSASTPTDALRRQLAERYAELTQTEFVFEVEPPFPVQPRSMIKVPICD